MLQEQEIPVDFGQGLDTKTDPKMVVSGKMLRLENAVFTNPKRIAKRNGYVPLSNASSDGIPISSPSLLSNYNNELVANDRSRFFSYSTSQNAWVVKDNSVSTEIKKTSVDQNNPSSGFVDSAVLGNYILYGWSTETRLDASFPANYPSRVFASVVDMSTGATLTLVNLFTATNVEFPNPVKCVVLGSSVLAILYVDGEGLINTTGVPQLICQTVSFSGNGVVTFNTPTIVSTNFRSTPVGKVGLFDVTSVSTGAGIIYLTTTGIAFSTIDTTGTVTHTQTFADASFGGPLLISLNTISNNFYMYWNSITTVAGVVTAQSIYYSVYNSTMTVTVRSPVAILTMTSPYEVSNMMSVTTTGTQQKLYYGVYDQGSSPATKVDKTLSALINDNGTAGPPFLYAMGITPLSRPFSSGFDGYNYAMFLYRGANLVIGGSGAFDIRQQQPTYFVLRLDDIPGSVPTTGIPLCVARLGSGLANSQMMLRQIISYNSNVTSLGNSKFLLTASIEDQLFSADSFEVILNRGDNAGGLAGSFSYTLDFKSPNVNRSLNFGQVSVLNGAVMQLYDGNKVSELNYHLSPEITGIQTNDGNISPGTYSYIAIFQWTDNQGNLHQSAPSTAVVISVVDPHNSVSLTITTNYLTQKTKSSVALYRTTSLGSVYYLVTDPIFLLDATPTTSSIVWTDGINDSDITGNPQSYTSPKSSVLTNNTPPPSVINLSHNNRLWMVDSENPNTVWYSKSFQPGTGISPSAFMTDQIDGRLGDITALAEMDEKIVFFKKTGILVQSGDGVNDTGGGSTLSFPQQIPSDVGCSALKSVITMPGGVMFQSINGIYLLGRSLGVSYIGGEVEKFNSNTITSANMIPGKSQIRFLCSAVATLVYDYIFNQWSIFTDHLGVAADSWQGSYVYSNFPSGMIYQEFPGIYTDNGTAYSLLAQTSWLHLGSVQGFQRVKRLIMLGDFVNGGSASHSVQVQASYDFNPNLQVALSYSLGSAAANGVFQYRERLPRQKCDSISLIIQEITTGDSAEFLDISNISFEAGVKKGVNKLASPQSVG